MLVKEEKILQPSAKVFGPEAYYTRRKERGSVNLTCLYVTISDYGNYLNPYEIPMPNSNAVETLIIHNSF